MRALVPLLLIPLACWMATIAPVAAAPAAGGLAMTRTEYGFYVAKAPNGQTFLLKEDHSAPLAIVNTWFRVGSRNELPDEEGISHFLEHMLFDGTTKRSKEDYDLAIFKHAFQDNASTSYDWTNYYLQGPSDQFRAMAELHAEQLMGPLLSDAEFGREREVVKEELRRAMDAPGSWLYRQVLVATFPHLNYDHQVLGTIETLDGTSNQQMRDYFHKYYGPNNAITVAIGDFKAEDALATLSTLFASWQTVTIAPDFAKGKDLQTAPRSLAYDGQFESTSQMLVFKAPEWSDHSSYAMDLAMQILGGGESSRLVRKLRDELGLVSDIGAGNNSLIDASALVINWTLIDPAKAPEATNAVLDVLNQFRREGATAAELARAKRQVAVSRVFENENLLGLARSLGSTSSSINLDYYEHYLDHVFGVTAQDVQWVAQQHLNSKNATLGIIGATGTTSINPDWTKIDAPFTPLIAPTDIGRVGTNPLAAAATGTVTTIDNPADRTFTLPNGLTVYLQPSSANATVAVSLAIKGGLQWESWDTAGTATLAMNSLTEGTAHYTKEQIGELQDEWGTAISTSASRDLLALNTLVLAADTKPALDLVADLVINPTFPDDGVALQRNQQLQRIAASQDDIAGATLEQLRYAFYGQGSAYGRPYIGRDTVVKSLGAQDCSRFHERVMNPQNAVLAIVGSFDPAEMRAMVTATFGSWSAGPLAESASSLATLPQPKNAEGAQRIAEVKDKAQAAIWIGVPGVGLTDPDLPALSVMNTILGSSSQARLFTQLRGKEGLAYGTYSSLMAGEGNGLILASIATRPEMYEQAVTGLRREITALAKEGPTPVEVTDAITYMAGQEAQRHQGHLALASFVASNIARGLPWNYEWELLDKVKLVTLDQVTAASAKYLNLDNHYLAVTGRLWAPPADLE
ncbi:MAG: pitrilysin family protein [bacterium]